LPSDSCSAPASAGGATCFVWLPLAGSPIVCTGRNIGGGSARSTPRRTWLRQGNLGNARTGLLGLRYDPELFPQAPTSPPLNAGDDLHTAGCLAAPQALSLIGPAPPLDYSACRGVQLWVLGQHSPQQRQRSYPRLPTHHNAHLLRWRKYLLLAELFELGHSSTLETGGADQFSQFSWSAAQSLAGFFCHSSGHFKRVSGVRSGSGSWMIG
jgi:hypothetical protein